MMVKPYGRTKVQENEDGKLLLGGGCKTCPVIACATATYRGSACASQRASHGLGDPMTNADRICAMSDEEQAAFYTASLRCPPGKNVGTCEIVGVCKECWLEWLRQPAEADS